MLFQIKLTLNGLYLLMVFPRTALYLVGVSLLGLNYMTKPAHEQLRADQLVLVPHPTQEKQFVRGRLLGTAPNKPYLNMDYRP